MATRIVVMRKGFIQQIDTPQNLYDKPVNLFVAGFIGTPQMNFIPCTLTKKEDGAYLEFEGSSVKLPADKANAPELADYFGKEVIAGIRPECIHDEPIYTSQMTDALVDTYVDLTELMGSEIFLYLKVGEQNLTARVSPRSQARSGDSVKVAFDTSRIHLFDKDSEQCILH